MKLFLSHISKSKHFWLFSVLLVFEVVQKYTSFLDQNYLVRLLIGIGALVSVANLSAQIRSFLGIGVLKPMRVIVLMFQTVGKTVIYSMLIVFLPLVIYFYRNPINTNNQQTSVMLIASVSSIFAGWIIFAYSLALFQDSSIHLPKKSLNILFKNLKSFSVYILIAIVTSLIPFIVRVASSMSNEPLSWFYPYHVVSSLIFTILLPFLFMKKFIQLEIPSSNTL